MASVPAVDSVAYERAIEALVRDVERRLSERLERNLCETSNALLADAVDPKSPTAVRSLMAAVGMIGLGPRRRWRKERRADERRLNALRKQLHAS